MGRSTRRNILGTLALALTGGPRGARAELLGGAMPWRPDLAAPPLPAPTGGWQFFSAAEAAAVEALVDRLIPPDAETFGGKDAGCAAFIDRQLAGPYGRAEGLYDSGPFRDGTEQQGPQSPLTPAAHYRQALAALDQHCRAARGAVFAALPEAQKDEIISDLENGKLGLGGKPGTFFKQVLKDTKQGFFADPIYGGNRDMAGWKMIGFPGAHYDYRDWVERHNERFPLPPVGIGAHPDWKGKG